MARTWDVPEKFEERRGIMKKDINSVKIQT
jgi:hypothetical protein